MLIATTLCYALKPATAQAQFQPPGTITLTMYRLVQGSGAIIFDPDTGQPIPCTKDDPAIAQSFGCTAITGDPNYAYPFDTSEITIGMEGHLQDGVQQGYLQNVVPSEMNPQNHHALAVQAQAVAARSFAYFESTFPTCSDGQAAIDNSNGDQVYLPFMYASLPTDAHRAIIDQAVAKRYYLSYGQAINACGTTIATDQPLFSEFSADAYAYTVEHPEQSKYPYLRRVADPISIHPEISDIIQATNAHQRGLSQNGASRWANGNLAADPNADKGLWSVRWSTLFQILTHYYSGIHLRDANQNNQIITPANRWVPLTLQAPHSACTGTSTFILVDVQNSGTTVWEADSAAVLVDQGTIGPSAAAPNSTPLPRLEPGNDAVVVVPVRTSDPGQTTYTLDMALGGQRFTDQTPAWPGYHFTIGVIDCPYHAMLPLVQGDSTATASSW
jgi:hypothetical protein